MLAFAIVALFLALAIRNWVSVQRRYKDIPGPFLSRFTSLPLAFHSRGGKRHLYVHSLHQKYGSLVLIAPSHISCCHPDAINVVYAQGEHALLKSDFYKAFVIDGTPNLFNTQDRLKHTKRRKALAHPLSYRSVKDMEEWIANNMLKLVRNLDKECESKFSAHQDSTHSHSNGVPMGAETPGRASGGGNCLRVNMLAWFNCFTFDVISDLAFGQSLGMLDRGTDVLSDSLCGNGQSMGVAAMIGLRGRAAAFLGLFPPLVAFGRTGFLIRWLLLHFWPDPLIRKGLSSSDMLSNIATTCVRKRMSSSDNGDQIIRDDLLHRLLTELRKSEQLTDDIKEPLNEKIVVTEAMLLLTAGSDTTADSATAILWYILAHPPVHKQLIAELDENVGILSHDVAAADELPKHDQVKSLPYLTATIQEALRMFATNAFGLPRVVSNTSNPVTLMGTNIPPGTELSVPAYTVQRDMSIWGEDAYEFKVQRWLPDTESTECVKKADAKYLLTFGAGPRMCIGKNLATLQLHLLIATILLRYKLELYEPHRDLEAIEGFMNKPVELLVKISRR
ncbi:cytochrome P450 [Lentinula aciculospora]|uniref:Cytochrome P450 n=1 Tax=Lentinula aciculospora TaxID=153920 RepID=A0A9W9AUL7_9AGAR|nr:cytochrome P450 [Lentinula aciculospora]